MLTAFPGDSITAWWPMPASFGEVANFGVPGETPEQIASRFDDVLAMRPSIVHILAGTNAPVPESIPFIVEMAEKAKAIGSDVLVGLIPPRSWDVSAFNALLSEACEGCFETVDYFSPMQIGNLQNPELFRTADSAHPNRFGAEVMNAAVLPKLTALRMKRRLLAEV